METLDHIKLWTLVLGEIEVGMSPASFQTWFKNTAIDEVDTAKGIVKIRVPNDFTRSWLQKKYQKEIHKCLMKHLGKVIMVQYIVGAAKPKTVNFMPLLEQMEKTPAAEMTTATVSEEKAESLNPRFTLDSFVVGENSKMCYAMAEAVIRQPGVVYNPLFIYGGVGLGKTHMLQAVGNELMKAKKGTKVLYLTSERFTNEMVEAIRSQTTKEFKDKYRKVDCLLIDDVQFLANKEQTQEEFFHTFNTLYNNGKQIVLTSDRPPKAIPGLEDRLRSRFEWGMLTDISAPSYETRLAILRAKIQTLGKDLPGENLEFIAKTIKNNVRELEGALNRILAYADLSGSIPTLDETRNLLGGLAAPGKKIVRPSEIIKAVATHFNLKKDDLTGRRRTKEIVIPRQILVYLLREEVDMPYKQIGSEIGGRDHTTIMHDYNKMKELILSSESLDAEIGEIKNKLYAVD